MLSLIVSGQSGAQAEALTFLRDILNVQIYQTNLCCTSSNLGTQGPTIIIRCRLNMASENDSVQI